MPITKFSIDTYSLEIGVIISLAALSFLLTWYLLRSFGSTFIKAGLHGTDFNKVDKRVLPEAQGIIAAAVYMVCMFLFIPLPFRGLILQSLHLLEYESEEAFLPEQTVLFKTRLIPFLAALLSICCMIFLGFADDVLNLRWRHKLLLPTLSSLPILMVHLANRGTTHIAVPLMFRNLLGTSIDIGFLYFVYMGMLAVFCTNAINIYAGVNGLEAGQSIVIAISVMVFNVVELYGSEWKAHLFSLYFIFPFTGVTFALLLRNWCPAKLFVGDTFCYFAGMTFAVVGILGHFSKTLMLFFIPQVFNFILSLPQLFRLIPCPRHRLPSFDSDNGLLHPSKVTFRPNSLSLCGRLCLSVLRNLHLTHQVHEMVMSVDIDDERAWEGEEITVDNLTLINLFLRVFGPMSEAKTTTCLLLLQFLFSCVAFVVRYPIAWALYGRPT